jgi:hypothetical protein
MSIPSQVQLQIVTNSQVMYFNNLPKPNPPKITMNGVALPTPPVPPSNPAGWQVVIIDPTKDITNPASIITNQYISLFPDNNGNGWWDTYQYLYSNMVTSRLNSGNVEQQLLLIASFGLDNNMPPTNDAYSMMMDIGAGSQVQYWETHCDVGSQVGNPTSWISFPANYILVGYVANSYGQGYEIYQNGSGPLATTLNATLYNNVSP